MSPVESTTTATFPAVVPSGNLPATILCIGSDPQVTNAIKNELSVDVLQTGNGMQGYWLAISRNPALILTDLRMTNGHGGAIIESLKENGQTCAIPVIVLTNQDYPGLHRHTRRLGATHCFQQPLEVNAVVRAVAEVLASVA